MGKMKILTRSWMLALEEFAYESSPMAVAHAEQLLDIAVAGSVQSLKETLDELENVMDQIMLIASQHEEEHKGMRQFTAYKRDARVMERVINVLAGEIKTYEHRIETNKNNNGRQEARNES